jgi:hypothetical protein
LWTQTRRIRRSFQALKGFGTATTLIVCGGMPEVVSFVLSTKTRRGTSDAQQMIPLTLAMLRLIERIRLADIRMANSSWSLVG